MFLVFFHEFQGAVRLVILGGFAGDREIGVIFFEFFTFVFGERAAAGWGGLGSFLA